MTAQEAPRKRYTTAVWDDSISRWVDREFIPTAPSPLQNEYDYDILPVFPRCHRGDCRHPHHRRHRLLLTRDIPEWGLYQSHYNPYKITRSPVGGLPRRYFANRGMFVMPWLDEDAHGGIDDLGIPWSCIGRLRARVEPRVDDQRWKV